jgi:tRNA-specific 2-thiouridylase
MKKRVVVAMSGGVDSSVAAALLKAKGYEVVGITMCFNLQDCLSKKPRCCGMGGIEDARRVAEKIGIRHYVLNMQKDLEKWVINDFCQEYLKGRTPNPCVRCNQYLKFNLLLKKALSLDARFLATGHYAKVVEGKDGGLRGYLLKRAKDLKKDQSYFLYRLTQEQLKHIIFPLGNYTKEQVRSLARKFKLAVADKPGSQEICFLPTINYRAFLEQRLKAKIKPGLIVDKQGNILGRHKGIAFYTVGQREGLGVARGYPLYITKIGPLDNRIIVGRREDALRKEFFLKEPHFIFRPIKKKVALKVRIRYNHKGAAAGLMPAAGGLQVCFKTAQFAITPGQAAVFYDKDTVIGGGVIEKVSD